MAEGHILVVDDEPQVRTLPLVARQGGGDRVQQDRGPAVVE
jgi:hypothetical protein